MKQNYGSINTSGQDISGQKQDANLKKTTFLHSLLTKIHGSLSCCLKRGIINENHESDVHNSFKDALMNSEGHKTVKINCIPVTRTISVKTDSSGYSIDSEGIFELDDLELLLENSEGNIFSPRDTFTLGSGESDILSPGSNFDANDVDLGGGVGYFSLHRDG